MKKINIVCCCCKECGKLFSAHTKLSYCQEHRYIDEQMFSIIEDYVVKHPLCNAIDVNRGTGISIQDLLRYINEGRLSVVENKVCVKTKDVYL